ncbi:hypothetical protein ACLMJK_007290 [Lecanora helva]
MAIGDDQAATAPLIRDREEDREAEEHGEIVQGSTSPSAFTWALTFAAAISGLLFGYDTGVISSTLVSIHEDLGRPLSTLDEGLITACTSLSALIISPITGLLADKFGRKSLIVVADLLFIAGALLQAIAESVTSMVLGRTIVGFAVGGASLLVPLYISELSPSAFRGKLVTLNILFVTLGQVVAYIIGYIFSMRHCGWRWMVGLGATPAFIQFGLVILLPESPRWLVKAGKSQEARKILQRVYASQEDALVEGVLRLIKIEIAEEETTSNDVSTEVSGNKAQKWLTRIQNRSAELFHVGGNRRALTIACLLQGLQQLCGFNSLMYFSATIFSLLNFSSPTLTSLSIATTNFTFTLIALLIIDRVGRRRIVLLSIPVMIAGLVVCAIAYECLDRPIWFTHPAGGGGDGVNSDSGDTDARSPWAIVILVAMIIYVCGYAIGLGNVAWQQSELFPLSVRSLGSGLATATNWGSNFVVGLTFLPMMQFLTPGWTFAVYAGVCAVGWVCVWRIYPETAGLALEDVREVLREGYGVGGVGKGKGVERLGGGEM